MESDCESIYSNDKFEFDEPEEIQEFEDFDETENGTTGNASEGTPNGASYESIDGQPRPMSLEEKKLARKEQKEQTLRRRLLKPNMDIINESKKIWEQVRHKNTTKEKKRELMVELMKIVRGKCLDVKMLIDYIQARCQSDYSILFKARKC